VRVVLQFAKKAMIREIIIAPRNKTTTTTTTTTTTKNREKETQ